MLKKAETCLYCAAPIKVPLDADYVRCESCGRIMEVTRFTREERRLTEAVDEARASADRAAEELRRCMSALDESQLEARNRAEAADRACRQALKELSSRLESSEARQMRSIYIQAENAQRAGCFEEAEHWYRKLLEHDDGEAEIYWRLVLCRYGVEYVCEQSSGRYLPTICHMVVDSVLENADYQAAVRCAGSEALRAHYECEARAIDAILEKYRQIRATEKPYDVFISVKQGDVDGNPTKDSFTAQKIQFELQSRLGLRVFNSRSSLEGHAGTEFEPYIMAALMSARVMVVVSSRPEYINAPWVRNEWRRFRWLKDNQPGDRRLIVFLTGMSVKDVPSAMGDLQAISNTDAEPVKSLIQSVQEVFGGKQPNRDLSNLLELAAIELEYGEFDKADGYCRKALVLEPRSARAYALQLCAEKKVRAVEALAQLDQPLDDCVNYQKAVRFADEAFRQAMQKFNQEIRDRAGKRMDVSDAQMQAARDALDAMENRRLVNEKQALQLSGEIQQLMQAQDDFSSFTDGAKLRARCGDLLAKCTAYLSEATGERQQPKYSEDEKLAWSELAALEDQKPDTLEKIVELNEKLWLFAKEHGDFKSYSEPSVLNARVYGKLTAIAADGVGIADDMLKEMESKPVGARGKEDRRKRLEMIRRFSGDPQLSSKQRAEIRRRCDALLPEATGGRQPPKYSADEKRAWSELAALEDQKPDMLEKIVELNEKLRLLAKEHGDFKGYSEPSVLNARVYGKLTAIAADGAGIADDMLKEMESKPVGARGKEARRKRLELIRRFSGDPQLSSKQRAEIRRRCDALLAQCDQPAEKESAKTNGLRPLDTFGVVMFLGGFALIDWGMVENGLSKNSAILACAVILILMLAIEKLLCGKRLTQRGEWPGFKLGGTMVLTAWLFIGVSSAIDLQDSFSADLQYHFNTFLIASALCVHMLISAIEMFVKKKRGRGCAAAAMFAGLVYYLVWFVS